MKRSGFKACAPPFRKGLGRGTYKFQVRAIDQLGQVEPKPEKVAFKVKRKRRR